MSVKQGYLPLNRPTPSSSSSSAASVTTIGLVVAFYFACSLSVVFLNKFILTYSSYKFPYALTVTWFQLIVALVVLVVAGELGKRKYVYPLIPPFELNQAIASQVAPLTVVYVLMLAFNNLCLLYVEVTFYQVARSLTILFTTFFTWYLLKQATSAPALTACFIVFIGFVLGSYGEINFSWAGIIYGLLSSCFVALYGIYVKKALKFVDDNQWRLVHYNTFLSIIFMFPFVLFSGELNEISANVTFLDQWGFWGMMTFTGFTGFLINIATFMQIKFTTPLTNTISGTAKACVQTLLAAMVFQNPISFMNGFGIFLSLLGSAFYSYVRYQEMLRRTSSK